MRLTKGTKVEVLMEQGVQCASWRGAEIVSGNGRTYTVTYDRRRLPDDDAAAAAVSSGFELRVRRNLIRPRPPKVGFTPLVGDTVEAWENHEWRMAKVCPGPQSDDDGRCVVRFVGTQDQRSVRPSHVRVRQSWRNGVWSLIDWTEDEFRRRNSRRPRPRPRPRSTNEQQHVVDSSSDLDLNRGGEREKGGHSHPRTSVDHSCSSPSPLDRQL